MCTTCGYLCPRESNSCLEVALLWCQIGQSSGPQETWQAWEPYACRRDLLALLARAVMASNDERRYRYAVSEQLHELLRGHRPAEIVPLCLVTFPGLQKLQLFQSFDALRNDP